MVNTFPKIPEDVLKFFCVGSECKTLLIKGDPGSAKTAFSLAISEYVSKKKNSTVVYLSGGVDPFSIYREFPWAKQFLQRKNIIDASEAEIFSSKDNTYYSDLHDMLRVLYTMITQKHPSILIIDGIDIMISVEGRVGHHVEYAILDLARKTHTDLITIKELPGSSYLEGKVDGIIVLRRDVKRGKNGREAVNVEIERLDMTTRMRSEYVFLDSYIVKFEKNCPLYGGMCALDVREKQELIGEKKQLKAFFMYQFDVSAFLERMVHNYLDRKNIRCLDAKMESHIGDRYCKICKLTLASDFGIASLSPFNYNVFIEVGHMFGLGKQVIFLFDKTKEKIKNVPFDLTSYIYIPYKNEEELKEGLERELTPFIKKLQEIR
ncbi:MAG: gas vesicle protein GvpD P-loop domain-containing protein [Euryarchaeota archaeon]|nr:gas vesicle protein GvpD P-loop domain-containing protein [Euryarchaeota archaeon]